MKIMDTIAILITYLLLNLVLLPQEAFAQPASTFCSERAESYPQCGGTLGLENKPNTETFWITRFIDCQGKIRYAEPISLGGLGQCPQCIEGVRKYPQCGGTLGLENFPPTHTIQVTETTDTSCKKIYAAQNLDDLGQCQDKRAAADVSSRGAATTQIGNPSLTNIGPNRDSCGKYKLDNPLGNFGDPTCKFTKDDLYGLLKSSDPVNADYWFYTIVRCESTYNPNAFNPGAPDKAGAWGLYQMGRGKAGIYDHGDVVWQLQTTNAVNYNNNLRKNGLAWRYWECAKGRW